MKHNLTTISVTPEIIQRSEKHNHKRCMVSRAIEAAAKASKILIRRVSTTAQRIRFDDIRHKRSYVFLTPKSIQRALINFDQGLHTEPFRFTMPRPVIDRQWKPKRKSRPAVKARPKTRKPAAAPAPLTPLGVWDQTRREFGACLTPR